MERRVALAGSSGVIGTAVSRAHGVPVFLGASAIGVYGDAGETECIDGPAGTPPGSGFLASLCVEWRPRRPPPALPGSRWRICVSGTSSPQPAVSCRCCDGSTASGWAAASAADTSAVPRGLHESGFRFAHTTLPAALAAAMAAEA